MKVLYAKWDSYMDEDISRAIKSLGHEVSIVDFKLEGFSMNPYAVKNLESAFSKSKFDLAFSINYYPEISNICERYNTKYASWTYDAPCAMIYDKSVLNSCNYIFSFDKKVMDDLITSNVKHVYYLPLAVEQCFMDVKDNDSLQFDSDISFVGSTYSEKLELFNQCYNAFPDYLKGYLTSVIDSQILLDGYFILGDAVSNDVENLIKNTVKINPPDGYLMSYRDFFANFIIGAKATSKQRIQIMNALSDRFNLNVHCFKGDPELNKSVNIKGPVDHDRDLGSLHNRSKINLNITMSNIQNGIPLRCFDIMGSGSFLMTNYREAFTELFVDGEDIVIYYNLDDLIAKVEYYLTHDEERIAIARNGQKKVRSLHTVPIKIDYILKTVTQ